MDYRKSLTVLQQETEACYRCDLGVRRLQNGGALVFGEGTGRGILFVGEGPGKDEEREGRAFVGKTGSILRYAISKLGLSQVYLTNAVACRSSEHAHSSEGQPIYDADRRTGQMRPRIKDCPPKQTELAACAPRLHEHIYLVDPVLIVALGGEALRALTGKPPHITAQRGSTLEIEIPGAGLLPSVTDKKKVWGRKVKGDWVMPTKQNMVRYLVLPTFHPSYVLRNAADKRSNNATQLFTEDLQRAAQIYDRYLLEAYGLQPGQRMLSEEDIRALGGED